MEEAWEGVHVSGTADSAYYYSTYNAEDKNPISNDKPKVMILGGGPNRIGQGIEFDYCCVHASLALKKLGFETIIVNCNPETVSTDYDTSDKLYFEPLCVEDVMNIIEFEKPYGVIATLGGQTAINLAEPLAERGVRIIGTDKNAIDRAENRDAFEKLLASLSIPQPKGKAVTNIEDGLRAAEEIGYPVLVRPSFVLGGRAMQIVEKIIDYTKRLGLGIGIIGLFNIQFIVDDTENVFIIEVNPRSSRTVPFLSKATGYNLADIATLVILGESLAKQGITEIYPKEKERFYVKVPAFSFSKLRGMDAYLSPEMKSTGEAIGYDKKLHRAMYKAMAASGIHLQNYGTVVVTLADEDKEEALPLVRRFYNLGFNIEATVGTADFLKANGIRTRIRRKLSEGSEEILESIRAGYVSYVINTRAILSGVHYEDGVAIRRCASENNITMLTSLDTVKVLLDVLEETTIGISTINS